MGEVNDVLCNYFSIPEIFADFWNGTLFDGRQELKSYHLYKHDKEYYKLPKRRGEKVSSIRRDVSKRYSAEVDIVLSMELMDTLDYTIAVRLMDYDVQEMKRQLQEIVYRNQQVAQSGEKWKHGGEFLYGFKKEDRLLPVISVALYCGKESYDGAKDVTELFQKPMQSSRWNDFMKKYPACIYELGSLEEQNYVTGLREVVAVFKRSKDKIAILEYYEKHKERFRQLDVWSIEAMGVLIGRRTLKLYTQEGEGLDMCKAFDDAIAEGREEGRIEGREEGRIEGAYSVLSELVQDGLLKLEEAAKRLNMTEEAFLAKSSS